MILLGDEYGGFVDPSTTRQVASPGPKDTVVLSPLIATTVVTRLPRVPEAELHTLLRYQLDRQFPMGGKGIEHDHVVLDSSDGERLVAIIGIDAETLADIRTRTNGARLTTAVGLFARGMVAGQQLTDDDESILVIGPGWTTSFSLSGGDPQLISRQRRDSLLTELSQNSSASEPADESQRSATVVIASATDNEAMRTAASSASSKQAIRFLDVATIDPRTVVPIFRRKRSRMSLFTRRYRLLRIGVLAALVLSGMLVSYFRDIAHSREYLESLRREVIVAQARSLESSSASREATRLHDAVNRLEERVPLDVYRLIATFLSALGNDVRVDGLSVAAGRVEVTGTSAEPFAAARRVQESGYFTEVRVSQIVTLSPGVYQFSIAGELNRGNDE